MDQQQIEALSYAGLLKKIDELTADRNFFITNLDNYSRLYHELAKENEMLKQDKEGLIMKLNKKPWWKKLIK